LSNTLQSSLSVVYSHTVVCSSCYSCVVSVDFRVFIKKKSRFLDDVHIVEALTEPVDDSGSEQDVSETEYSPWYGYYNILTILIIVFKYT